MIISHKHRFIFIHCRKAAGSSVAVSLSRYLGADDLQFSGITDGANLKIYPPMRVVKEAMQSMTPSEYISILLGRRTFFGSISNSIKRRYMGLLGESPAHAPATAVAAAFPHEWRDYFKFCIVRNPWCKTVSDYFWRTKRMANPPSFEEYVVALRDGRTLDGVVLKNHQNWDMYTIEDRIAVDYAVRFEQLTEGLSEALSHTTIDWDAWLPHMKSGAEQARGSSRRNYHEFYTADTAQIVYLLYKNEVEMFGYSY